MPLSPDQAQNAQIGGALGNAIGSITGIPGLGQLGSVIGGLFGPSVHTDPAGIPQDQVQGEFEQIAQEMFAAVNQARAAAHLPPVQFPALPAPGGAAMASWSTAIMSAVLYENLNSSSQDRLAQLREDGTMDAAIAAIQSIIAGLQRAQAEAEAAAMSAAQTSPSTLPTSYGAATGTAAPPAPGSYQSVQSSSNPAPAPVEASFAGIGAWVAANPGLSIMGAIVLVLLLTSGGGGNAPQQGNVQHAAT